MVNFKREGRALHKGALSSAGVAGRVVGWLLVGLIVYGSLTPNPVNAVSSLNDKFQHIGAYFICMAWFAQVLENSSQVMRQMIFLVGLAVVLEFAQPAMGGRVFEPADMLFSAAGVLLALLVPRTILRSVLSSFSARFTRIGA